MNAKRRKKVLTSGSGPSYSKWRYWHTWTRMLPLYFCCDHKDVSGPAAGNKFISRAVINNLVDYDPDIVIVQWNLGRLDLYIENKKFVNEIIHSASERNFIVDIHTGNTTQESGYWCSSFDNTIPWKKYYNTHIKNETALAMDDLEQMLLTQELCSKKGVDYFFVVHGKIDHDYLYHNHSTRIFYNEIDWTRELTQKSLSELYNEHPIRSEHIEIKNAGCHVPNPIFQLYFLENIIAPCLELQGIVKHNKTYLLTEFIKKQHQKLREIFIC